MFRKLLSREFSWYFLGLWYNAPAMDDLEFVQSCVKGEKLAWDEFVDKYSHLIYRYIHSVLKFKGINLYSQDNVNDIFQEIFVNLSKDNFKKLRSFKGKNGCSLASWLRQVVINYTIDCTRKLKPMISLDEELDDGFSLSDIIPGNTSNFTDKLITEEKLATLTDCIQELDNDDKFFLELYMNRGLTLEELKGILRLSRPAVDMRKSRFIVRLRNCFKKKGFELDF